MVFLQDTLPDDNVVLYHTYLKQLPLCYYAMAEFNKAAEI